MGRRETLARAALAVLLLGGLFWALPQRRPGEDGGHHARHAERPLDPFEKAGVHELTEGQHGLRDRGLVVLAVSVDRRAPRALIEPYVRNAKLTFPILLDPELRTSRAWRVTGLPATFLVRPGGEVVGMAAGAREWDSEPMRALVERLLPDARGRE